MIDGHRYKMNHVCYSKYANRRRKEDEKIEKMCCFRLGITRSALRLLCLNRLKYINRDSQYCVSVLCAAEQKGCKPTIISNCTKTIRRMLSKFAIEWSCRCVHGYRVTEDERQITNWYELNDNQTRKREYFFDQFFRLSSNDWPKRFDKLLPFGQHMGCAGRSRSRSRRRKQIIHVSKWESIYSWLVDRSLFMWGNRENSILIRWRSRRR